VKLHLQGGRTGVGGGTVVLERESRGMSSVALKTLSASLKVDLQHKRQRGVRSEVVANREKGATWQNAPAGRQQLLRHQTAGMLGTPTCRRRVQLVRRDGRDVSTLYGREGGGGGRPRQAHGWEQVASLLGEATVEDHVPEVGGHARGRLSEVEDVAHLE